MAQPDQETEQPNIQTNGGSYIEGAVSTGGGDFIGRDKVTITEEQSYRVHGLANPYLGLRSFTYADHAIYAGREQLAQEALVSLVAPGRAQNLLFITGASGSGKSSFVQAALLPRLETHYMGYGKIMRHIVFRPSTQPMVMLQDALSKLHPTLRPENLAVATQASQVNVLVIDQFEEVFNPVAAEQWRHFRHFLEGLPPVSDARTHVLITMRIDYLEELFASQPLWNSAKQGIELRAMGADELRDTIQKPLQVHYPHKRFAPELLARLVQDASGDPTLLPLLQVTLAELWKQGSLTLGYYNHLTDAIRQRAEWVYAYTDHARASPHATRSEPDRAELLRILLDLINVAPDGSTRQDVRQRRPRSELEMGSSQRQVLIEELINARLLAVSTGTLAHQSVEWVDIIHESLIANWDRLRRATDEERQRLQQRARFQLWLGLWLENARSDEHLLLTQIQLAEAAALASQNDIELQNVTAHTFYEQSLQRQSLNRQRELDQAEANARAEARAEAEAQTAHAMRRRAVVLSIATALALVAALIAGGLFTRVRQTQQALAISATGEAEARMQADANAAVAKQAESAAEAAKDETERLSRAIRADQLTATAVKIHQQYPQRALLLALEGIKMQLGRQESLWPSTMGNLFQLLSQIGGTPLRAQGNAVLRVAFSPDSHWLALATGQTEEMIAIYLWDMHKLTVEPFILRSHLTPIYALAFSPDSQTLVSGGSDGTIRLWSLTGDNFEPVDLPGHIAAIYQLAFSPDGHWLASSGRDHALWLWNLTDASHPAHRLCCTVDDLPAGWEGIVSSEADFDLIQSKIPEVHAVVFSRDGQQLAAAVGPTIRIWHVASIKDKPRVLSPGGALPEDMLDVKFSANDQYVIGVRGRDSHVYLWDETLATSTPLTLTTPFFSAVFTAMSPDGNWLAVSGGEDGVRLWDMTNLQAGSHLLHEPLGSQGIEGVDISEIAFSPDNQQVAIANGLGEIRLWRLSNLDDGPTILLGHEGAIVHLAFSPDGRWLASAGLTDHTARLWSLDHLFVEPRVLTRPGYTPFRIAHSLDGATLALLVNCRPPACAQFDLLIELRSTADPSQALQTLGVGPEEEPEDGLTISPDGRWLASGAYGQLMVWDLQRPQTKPTIVQIYPEMSLIGAAYHPGGQWLAVSAGLTSNAQKGLLEIRSATNLTATPIELSQQPGRYECVLFSPDGRMLVNCVNDEAGQRVQVWQFDASIPRAVLWHELDVATSKLAFSADGRWLAGGTTSFVGHLWLWDITHPDVAPTTLANLDGWIGGITFSPDNQWLAAGGIDGKVRLWNLQNPTFDPIVLSDIAYYIYDVKFSPDGEWLMSANQDERTRLWHMRIDQLSEEACRAASRNLTQSEWKQAFPDQPYHKTCPGFPLESDALAQARRQAEAGNLAEARRTLEEVVRHDGALQFDPAQEAQSLAAWHYIDEAKSLAADSKVDEAVVLLRQTLAYTVTPSFDPVQQAQRWATAQLIEAGQRLAWQGEVTSATISFQQALTNVPGLLDDPEAEAKRWAAIALFKQAQQLAHDEATEEAAAKFARAVELNPQLQTSYAAQMAFLGYDLAQRGEVEEALPFFVKAQAIAPGIDITKTLSASSWNHACWDGLFKSLARVNNQVVQIQPTIFDALLLFCERAVESAPEDGSIRDSRGVVRALRGDITGALDDFEFAVAWAQRTDKLGQAFLDRRLAWIDALKAGRNPFDASTIAALQKE